MTCRRHICSGFFFLPLSWVAMTTSTSSLARPFFIYFIPASLLLLSPALYLHPSLPLPSLPPSRMCPIFQISNVTGENMELLKMFLNLLSSRTNFNNDEPAEFQIDDTYSVPVRSRDTRMLFLSSFLSPGLAGERLLRSFSGVWLNLKWV